MIGRTKEQKEYAKLHPKCEVCGRDEGHIHVHHIDRNRRNNVHSNFFSLCCDHHTGDRGIHLKNEVEWIEQHQLTDHPKWKERYERLKSKSDFIKGRR